MLCSSMACKTAFLQPAAAKKHEKIRDMPLKNEAQPSDKRYLKNEGTQPKPIYLKNLRMLVW